MPSEFLVIDYNDFMKLGRDFAESFLKFSKVIPDDKELRRALVEMHRWNTYKTSMTKSIKANQVNVRQNFD